MRNQSQVIAGLALIGVGLIFLVGVLLRVNVSTFCWPVGLIAVGAWFLLRPSLARPGTRVGVYPLAEVRRSKAWDAGDEEIWILVGNVRLDLSKASLVPGESTIKVFGVVGQVALVVPEGVPVSLSSYAFLTDGKVYGVKQEQFFTPVRVESDGYAAADARVMVECFFVVNDLRIERP